MRDFLPDFSVPLFQKQTARNEDYCRHLIGKMFLDGCDGSNRLTTAGRMFKNASLAARLPVGYRFDLMSEWGAAFLLKSSKLFSINIVQSWMRALN